MKSATRRRCIVATAAFAASLAMPRCALAQQPAGAGPKRVAILLGPSNAPDPIGPTRKYFAAEFAKYGLVDGRDIEILILRGPADPGVDPVGLTAIIDRAVALRPHVVILHIMGSSVRELVLPRLGNVALVAIGNDESYLEESLETLNRQGENVTGSLYNYTELVSRRFGLMKQLRPTTRRVAFAARKNFTLTPKQEANDRLARAAIVRILEPIGLELVDVPLAADATLDAAIAEIRKARVDAVEARLGYDRATWDRLAASGIAACGIGPGAARNGALLSGWSVGFNETAIRLAAKVLQGHRASSVPVERVREYGLAINLSTARKLGLEVPPAVRLLANEVFE